MLPLFPRFKKLALKEKKEIERFIRRYPPYSDFNFTSMWIYNTQNDFTVSKLYGNLVFCLRNYLTQESFFTFFGTDKVNLTIRTVLDLAIKKKITSELRLIPEITINSGTKLEKDYIIEEDNTNHDYILSVDELILLKGNKFEERRYHVNKFKKTHADYEVILLDLKKPVHKKKIVQTFGKWKEGKDFPQKELENETKALHRLLRFHHDLNLTSIGIFHEGEMLGFCISEVVHDSYAMGHFMKGDTHHNGIFETLHYNLALILKEKGVKYINSEQDLGLTSLRRSKQSWQPVKLLKKYRIRYNRT